jgi:signal transduction histidine kinase
VLELVGLVAVAAVSYAYGAFASRLAGAVATLLLLLALASLSPDALVPATLCTVGPWFAGRAVRRRGALVVALAERTRELEAEEAERARLAVRHERARVARELHDVAAHELAVVVVQAGAGRLDPPAPGLAAERLAAIHEAAARALAEMAQLDELVAAGDRDAVLGGPVAAGDLDAVLDQARAAGLDVRATLPADIPPIARQVVREALTNALKHAPGAAVEVLVARDGDDLRIDVRDGGARSPGSLAASGAGFGLRGLRERVEAAGGTLQAGPQGGGWTVAARLPYPSGVTASSPSGATTAVPAAG